MSLDVFWWTIALPLSLLLSRRPCGHQWNVRQWSTILWRRRCRWWSGCAMHLRRYVSTHNHNLMTMPFVITHKEITLYLSIVSYGIVARGRAAAISYNIDSVPAGARGKDGRGVETRELWQGQQVSQHQSSGLAQFWGEFPQTVSKSTTLSLNTNTYLNAEVRRNVITECLWFWNWCARYRI